MSKDKGVMEVGKAVYVLTITYLQDSSAHPFIHPEVFNSAEGAKEYALENWGLEVIRMSPSHWARLGQDGSFGLRIDKRHVFKR